MGNQGLSTDRDPQKAEVPNTDAQTRRAFVKRLAAASVAPAITTLMLNMSTAALA